MTQTEHDTLVMTIRTERQGQETRDVFTEQLLNALRLRTGVVGASMLKADTLDELRSSIVSRVRSHASEVWRSLADLADCVDREMPECVEAAFTRGVASMLLPLQQEEAFARHDLAEGLRFAAEMAFQHRDAVRANRRLQLLAAEFAGLLDSVTGVAMEQGRAELHMQTIRDLIGTDAGDPTATTNESNAESSSSGQEDM